jgi:hypothetical protein
MLRYGKNRDGSELVANIASFERHLPVSTARGHRPTRQQANINVGNTPDTLHHHDITVCGITITLLPRVIRHDGIQLLNPEMR